LPAWSGLARCLAGVDRPERGEVRVAGAALRLRSPRAAANAGIVMVPEDRKAQGLVLGRSIAENFALGQRRGADLLGFALPGRLKRQVQSWMVRSDIRPRDPGKAVRQLSGGNQQKVLLSKWLARDPRVFIADEPTRGVDVGAKAAIHQMLADAAASGIGVVLISSELEELMGLSHRIVVFRKGRVVAEFPDPARSGGEGASPGGEGRPATGPGSGLGLEGVDREEVIAAAFGNTAEAATGERVAGERVHAVPAAGEAAAGEAAVGARVAAEPTGGGMAL